MTTPASALLKAATKGDLERIKQLEISANANDSEGFRGMCEPVKDCNGRTALHYAAEEGKTRMCKYLIETVKVDPNVKTGEGYTPFFLALTSEHIPTATYLLKYGGANQRDHLGMTSLHYAAKKGLLKFMQLLISEGAEIDAIFNYGTPLQDALTNGQKEAVRILLDHKANPNPISPISMSPLMLSIISMPLECMEMLLKAGADPNVKSGGMTALAFSASEKNTGYMKLLLKAGADPNIFDVAGMTPLEHAAKASNIEGVKILLPLTSRITSFPEWSCCGIICHFHSFEGEKQRDVKKKDNFQLAKKRVEAVIQRKDYLDALCCYTEALFLYPKDAKMLSNRSLCWARLNDGARALIDAEACVKLKPTWAKAHYREGVAWALLKDDSNAAEAFSKALNLEPHNKEIRKAFNESVADEFGLDAMAMGDMGVEVCPPLSDDVKVFRFIK